MIDGAAVARFRDSGNVSVTRPSTAGPLPAAGCNNADIYDATIDWGDGTASSAGSVSCSGKLDEFEVRGSHTYNDSGVYSVNVTVTDSNDGATATGKTDTATISDLSLSSGSASNITKVEGAKATVSASFADDNHAYSKNEAADPGLKATINWGDGSTATPDLKIKWGDDNKLNVVVTGSHVYDSNKPATKQYDVTVTLNDDGVDIQASDTLTATVSDAALTADTAKAFTAPAGGQVSNAVVASFKDAAGSQAKPADFSAATIKWGDGVSSAGTVTETGPGAFNVSGSHSYATAGTKAVTITVSDEEGSTLSTTASILVPPLPTTGLPTNPTAPAMPLSLLGIALGLLAIAFGGGQLLIRKLRS